MADLTNGSSVFQTYNNSGTGVAELGENYENVVASSGIGPRTFVVTFSKSSITNAESLAAIKTAEREGNTVAGVIEATNVTTVFLQGAGITAGSNYGASGVTAAVYATLALNT